MNSLFWKIFVSFWLSLLLFASLTLWLTSYYLDTVRANSQLNQPHYNIKRIVDKARQVASQKGVEGLRNWLRQLDKDEAIPYLLLDENGKDLINRQVPLRLQQRILKIGSRPRKEEHEHNHFRIHNLILVGDQHYYLVPDFQNITLGRVLSRPAVITIPFIIAILISGIVCFLLARYLTAPIEKLRRATNKLAAGDLTQRVSALMGKRKDEIVELANDFDHMAEQLQQLVASHKQLLRDASHELRSPLARLQVALGLARQRSDADATTEFDRIERETERLNELIGQLLSLARLETGSTRLQKDEFIDLARLLQDIAQDASYEARATQRDVKITHCITASIHGDIGLLHSALENVIRNAIRFTAENSCIELSLGRDPANPAQVEIRIRDHGPGIPDEMLGRIFEPFVRISEARERLSGGYGLGLAIANQAITLHGGKMTAQNETGGGLSIIIHLPA